MCFSALVLRIYWVKILKLKQEKGERPLPKPSWDEKSITDSTNNSQVLHGCCLPILCLDEHSKSCCIILVFSGACIEEKSHEF